jgi:hypothetical protein
MRYGWACVLWGNPRKRLTTITELARGIFYNSRFKNKRDFLLHKIDWIITFEIMLFHGRLLVTGIHELT